MDSSNLANSYLQEDPSQDVPFKYQFQLIEKTLINVRNKKQLQLNLNQHYHHQQLNNNYYNNNNNNNNNNLNSMNGVQNGNNYNFMNHGSFHPANKPPVAPPPSQLNSRYSNYNYESNFQPARTYNPNSLPAINTDTANNLYYNTNSSSSLGSSTTPTSSTSNYTSNSRGSSVLFAPRPLNSQYQMVNGPSSSSPTNGSQLKGSTQGFDAFLASRPNSSLATTNTSTSNTTLTANTTGSSLFNNGNSLLYNDLNPGRTNSAGTNVNNNSNNITFGSSSLLQNSLLMKNPRGFNDGNDGFNLSGSSTPVGNAPTGTHLQADSLLLGTTGSSSNSIWGSNSTSALSQLDTSQTSSFPFSTNGNSSVFGTSSILDSSNNNNNVSRFNQFGLDTSGYLGKSEFNNPGFLDTNFKNENNLSLSSYF